MGSSKNGVVSRTDFRPLTWNEAHLRAYIDTALGSHETTGDEVALTLPLTHFGVETDQTAAYPCTGNIMDAAKPSETDFDVSAFKSGVMKLMYLSTRTRPDVAFVVSTLACRAERPK